MRSRVTASAGTQLGGGPGTRPASAGEGGGSSSAARPGWALGFRASDAAAAERPASSEGVERPRSAPAAAEAVRGGAPKRELAGGRSLPVRRGPSYAAREHVRRRGSSNLSAALLEACQGTWACQCVPRQVPCGTRRGWPVHAGTCAQRWSRPVPQQHCRRHGAAHRCRVDVLGGAHPRSRAGWTRPAARRCPCVLSPPGCSPAGHTSSFLIGCTFYSWWARVPSA